MELIILDRKSFAIKDHVSFSDNFEIKLDLVISQKSSIKLSAVKINGSIRDYIFIKSTSFEYLGMIESIDDEVDGLILGTTEFRETFDREVKVASFSGIIANYLELIIRNIFVVNSDNKENLSFLSISKETSKLGDLTFEADKVMTITEIIELISKSYGVNLKEEVVISNGQIVGVLLRIVNVSQGMKLKGDTLGAVDLAVNESSETSTNKVTFYPKEENTSHTDIKTYYLLTDGSITENPNHELRYDDVSAVVKTYSDNDYDTLSTKATEELSVTRTNHQISFTVDSESKIIKPFINLNLGDFIEFRYKGKIYDSIVTGMSFTNTLKACLVTLGEYRIKLTEKIQILTKSVNTQIGHISINKSSATDLDGGEY